MRFSFLFHLLRQFFTTLAVCHWSLIDSDALLNREYLIFFV